MKDIIKVMFILRTISSKHIYTLLDKSPNFIVVKTLSSLEEAKELMVEDKVDVVLLEASIIETEGLDFVQYKQKEHPNIPIILLAPNNHKKNIPGINDYLLEPKEGFNKNPMSLKTEFTMMLYSYGSEYKVRRRVETSLHTDLTIKKTNLKTIEKVISQEHMLVKNISVAIKLIVIGASTGGPGVIKTILSDLDAVDECPPIFITQHIHPDFVAEFVKNTDDMMKNISAKIARNGEIAKNNEIYVCPGNKYMSLMKTGNNILIRVKDDSELKGYKPYVDELFTSAADFGKSVIGIILTGMGQDGAIGLKAIFDNGGFTICQDEKSSIVYGMPKAAFELGGVSKQMAAKDIARGIMKVIAISRYSESNGANLKGLEKGFDFESLVNKRD